MLIDLEVKRKSKEFSYDIIIIGAGASGITCANKINQLNPTLKIALIESGGLRKNELINSLEYQFSLHLGQQTGYQQIDAFYN